MFPAGALWRKPKPIQCGRVMDSMLCAVKGENARIFNDKVLAFFCVVPLGQEYLTIIDNKFNLSHFIIRCYIAFSNCLFVNQIKIN